ncbi:hypothetical protein M9H77_23129 [Catharanthus roseus]|uniref:Uncharacterized protein n=1 Tax=Catharanthus roseus TaxID=4058 RepID=A0ACC0ASU7_CATRO|nr:hypothetical protein M9H77_23129 [Catharanthus roseus]
MISPGPSEDATKSKHLGYPMPVMREEKGQGLILVLVLERNIPGEIYKEVNGDHGKVYGFGPRKKSVLNIDSHKTPLASSIIDSNIMFQGQAFKDAIRGQVQ